jgi:pimeloyl-ACP methyl ester carboxylesterase
VPPTKHHPSPQDPEDLELSITDIDHDEITPDGYCPLRFHTNRGLIECRYYPTPAHAPQRLPSPAAIFVGGAGGGFDTPVRGSLYPLLCHQLSTEDHIPCLRIRYRHPTNLLESTIDVLAGIAFLEHDGATAIALTGHSFGGAVVIQAASHSPLVRTCLPLSTQSHGTDPAPTLGPHCSLFLAHGTHDEVLPPLISERLYRLAKDPKHLELCQGATHGLDQTADYLPQQIRSWIRTELSKPIP